MKRLSFMLALWLACAARAWSPAALAVSLSPEVPSNAYIIGVAQRAGFSFDEQPPGQTGRNRLLVFVGEHNLTDDLRPEIFRFDPFT
jgi:hypothetical protein